MFNNLEAELRRKRITRAILANEIGISATALSSKLNGKSKFTLDEAIAIQKFLNVDIDLRNLFSEEPKLQPTGT